MKLRSFLMLVWIASLTCVCASKVLGDAVFPPEVNYQGVLENAAGPVSGDLQMTFSLYDCPDAGTCPEAAWQETQTVSVQVGVYNVLLGSVSPFAEDPDLQPNTEYWLGIQVGADPEMTPRLKLTSVFFAFMAATANNAKEAEKARDSDRLGSYAADQYQRVTTGECTPPFFMRGLHGNGEVICDKEIDPEVNTLGKAILAPCADGQRVTRSGSSWICADETDPVYTGDPASGISTGDITNWNTAYGWGDHTSAGYDTTDDAWIGTGDLYTLSGKVGIGTSSPSEQLEITGNLKLPVTTTTTGIIRSGVNTLIHTYGTQNFFAGSSAGNLSMQGGSNTATGYMALNNNETGDNNTASGRDSLANNTLGSDNTAIGVNALNANSTANKNTAVGVSALHTQSYDNGGTAFDTENVAVGYEALYSNQPTPDIHNPDSWTGAWNTAVGSGALRENTEGQGNSALGDYTLYANTTGRFNAAVGASALTHNTQGSGNTAMGYYALGSNLGDSPNIGSWNTAVGYAALANNTTGSYNTAIGDNALGGNHTGSHNTAIGESAGVMATDLTNATAIGYSARVDASNKVRIGNSWVEVIEGAVAWSNPSDERIKKDIEDLKYGLDFINQLRPVQYRLKEGNDRIDFGFIAQDVEALLGTDYNILGIGQDPERMLSLRYADLIAPVVRAIQEQQEIIEDQQSRIEVLEQQQAMVEQQQSQIDELQETLKALRKSL